MPRPQTDLVPCQLLQRHPAIDPDAIIELFESLGYRPAPHPRFIPRRPGHDQIVRLVLNDQNHALVSRHNDRVVVVGNHACGLIEQIEFTLLGGL